MKKLIYIALCLSILFSFTACSGENGSDTPGPAVTPTPVVTAAPTATATPTPVATAAPPADVEPTPQATAPILHTPAFGPVDVITDGNALQTANALTPMLVSSLNARSESEFVNPDFSEFYIICFMATVNPDCAYKNIFPEVGYNYQFKITDINKLIHQLLGDKTFDAMYYADKLPNGSYNPQTDALEFSTDFGWGGLDTAHTGNEITSRFSDVENQVVTRFELFCSTGNQNDPETASVGWYNLIYDVVTDEGETFLRVNRFEKER